MKSLEGGADVQEILLEKPPGKKGYVLKLAGQGTNVIYIKLQLGSGNVIGRSFHLSNRPGTRGVE